MADTITITRAVQTCLACPSRWDAWDADGRYYYLRYRFGHGTVEMADSPEDYRNPATPEVLISEFMYGHELEGEIELEEFARLAGLRLELVTEAAR